MHRIKDNELVYNLRAQSIQWDTAKKKWKLTNIVERTIKRSERKNKNQKTI